MRFYEIPNSFNDEIDSFAAAIDAFLKQQLHPTKFRAIRVPFGVYEQGTKGTFMLRIRMTAGGGNSRPVYQGGGIGQKIRQTIRSCNHPPGAAAA